MAGRRRAVVGQPLPRPRAARFPGPRAAPDAATHHRRRTSGMSDGRNRLEGRAALVTGAGSGFGAEIARRFAAEGARVAVNDLRADAAQSTVDAIAQFGGTAVA